MTKRDLLLPAQLDGVEFLKQKLPVSQYQHRWLAYEPGTGKTPITCQAIQDERLESGCVVCPDPAAVKWQWFNHLVEWAGVQASDIQIIWTGKDTIRPDARWIIVGYSLVIKPTVIEQIYNHRFYDVLVVDEAKRLKGLSSLRSRGILGAPDPLIERAQRLYFLDGTPMPNRTAELYPVLASAAREVIAPHTTYDQFGKQYCGGWNAKGEDGNYRGNSNTDELAERLRPFMLRRTMVEVFGFEPDVVEEDLFIDVEITDDNGYLIDESNCHLATLRKRIGICKLPFIHEYLAYAKNEGADKILVFTYHREVTEQLWFTLNRDFPGSAVKHYGGMSDSLKGIALATFKEDPNVSFMIAQVNSAGEALDGLQYACHTIVRAEPDWSHGLYEQNLGRLKRWGQTKAIKDLTLPAKGTLDERVVQSRRRRKRIAYRLLDNRVKVIPQREEIETMSLEQDLAANTKALQDNTAAIAELIASMRGQQIQPAPQAEAEAPKETAAQKKAREKAEKEAAAAAAAPAESPKGNGSAVTEITEEQVRDAAGAAHAACLARGMSDEQTMNAVKGVTKVIGFENLAAVLALKDETAKNLHLAKLVELYGKLEKGETPAPAAKSGLDI